MQYEFDHIPGYDANDLDLDLFCQEIIHVEIENLKRTPCLNAYLPESHKVAHRQSMTVVETADVTAIPKATETNEA